MFKGTITGSHRIIPSKGVHKSSHQLVSKPVILVGHLIISEMTAQIIPILGNTQCLKILIILTNTESIKLAYDYSPKWGNPDGKGITKK